MTVSIESLTARDLPRLEPGMTNVTAGPRRGYRFLPHPWRFRDDVTISVPYCQELIPPGLDASDVRTFYFDDDTGSWEELERVEVDPTAQTVVSRTNHFTDIINATITVPDHPEPLSYNPNSIKDLKAADPSAGIDLIEAPTPNSKGEARLSYPIEVLPGRNGMQPRLALTYNSSGGNGWIGMGWDIAVSSVTIDTRWGVPRYDPDKETETYLLDDEQLTPLANRGDLLPRSGDKREFHTRVEGQFRRIVRRGDRPDRYLWQVTAKDGTKFLYGRDPAANEVDGETVLADPSSGNIFRWMLREVRDPNGNTMRYRYDVVNGGGGAAGEPWRQTYLHSIRYTGRAGGGEGAYEIVFHRESGRPDVIIDGRAGFMTVVRDLLTSVDVLFNNRVVRSYRFEYRKGDSAHFGKSLLTAIAVRGLDGSQELYRHSFDYFGMGRSTDGLAGFGTAKVFNSEADTLGRKNGLSRTESSITGGGGSIGVGLGPLSLTGGGGGLGGSDDTKRTFVDSAGKGLPGFVDDSGAALISSLFPSGADASASFQPASLTGLPDHGLGHSGRSGWNVEGSLKIGPFTGGANYTRNSVSDDHVMVDMNGDGLVDLVSNDDGCLKVQLNNGGTGFHPYQNPNTGSQCWGNVDFSNVPLSHQGRVDTAQEAAFLVDPLVRWTAPIGGTVTISGAIRKVAVGGDGFNAEIYHGGTLVWRRTFAAGDLSPCTPSGSSDCNGNPLSVSVAAGDRLYFKVGSIADTAKDDVHWSPTVVYQVDPSLLPLHEPYGPLIYSFSQQQDFRLAGRPSVMWIASAKGSVHVGGLLSKQTTSDDVRFEVEKVSAPPFSSRTIVFSQSWPASSTTPGSVAFDAPQDIPVVRGDQLFIRAVSDTAFDPDRARWEPHIQYTSFCRPEPGAAPVCGPVIATTSPTGQVVYRIQGDPDPDLTLPAAAVSERGVVRYPVFAWRSPEPSPQEATRVLKAPRTGSLHFTGTLKSDPNVAATVFVQGLHRLLYKKTFPAGLSTHDIQFTADAARDDELYITVYSRTETAAKLKIAVDGVDQTSVVNYRHLDPSTAFEDDSNVLSRDPMSGGYHNWSVGDWRDSVPVDPSQIVYPAVSPLDLRPDPTKPYGLALPIPQGTPAVASPLWTGRGFDEYVAAGQMKPSRVAFFSRAPNELRTATSWNLRVGLGVSYGGVGLGADVSIGDSSTEIDIVDFNGDGYPDVISAGVVRFNDGRGGFSEKKIDNLGVAGALRETANRDVGANAGGGKSFNLTDTKSKTSKIVATEVSAGLDYGLSSAHLDLIDINGDGLPDQVSTDREPITDRERILVRLNLGYRLGREFEWPRGSQWATKWISEGGIGADVLKDAFEGEVKPDVSLRLQDTGSNNVGFGGKLDIGVVSIGGGAGWTFSVARGYTDLLDVNGDGLPDQVMRLPGEGKLRVKLNLGDRFDNERQWELPAPWGVSIDDRDFNFFQTEDALSFRRSKDFTVNGSAGFCIGVCFGGSVYHSSGSSSSHMGLYDADGDGKADFVMKKDGDPNLRVKLNRTGKTNLLKSVRGPLGAVFDLDYARSGNTTDQPGNVWVLSRTCSFDGVKDDGDAQVVANICSGVLATPGQQLSGLTSVGYEKGKYDRTDREFLGFRTVVDDVRDPATDQATGGRIYRGVIRTYRNDNSYDKGLLENELTVDREGKKLLETSNTYNVVTVADGSARPGLEDLTATRFPQLVRTEQRFYEGESTPRKTTYTTQQFNARGNVTQFFDAGDSSAADDVTATFEYSGCTDAYIVGEPTTIVVKSGGREMRRREANVDCATGNMTQVRQYLANGAAAITDLDYFDNGNLRKIILPQNLNHTRSFIEYTYDPTVQTHITKITDNLGYSSRATYDLKYGELDTNYDVNNNRTKYTYDAFGRLASVTGPYDTDAKPTITFVYHPEAEVPWSLTKHLDTFRDPTGADTIDMVLFTDGLKRVLQTKKDATIHVAPDNPADERQMIVSGRVTFDFLGRTVEQRYPTTEPLGTPGIFKVTPDGVAATVMKYDVLDRNTETKLPDQSTTTIQYGFGSDRSGATQFETTVTDARGIQKKTYRDVRGLITAVKEFHTPIGGATQDLWTSYTYDPLKQLLEVRDAKNNRTSLDYDNLGRRTVVDNPDSGKTETVYDLASNATAKITANLRAQNAKVAYDYDAGNRLTTISYPNFPANNVTYTYGAPLAAGASDPANRAGRITKVTDQSGSEERFYGKLGEITKENKTVVGFTGAQPDTYTTQYVFDTFGRLQSLTYPDGEALKYRYDSGGLLKQATGVKGPNSYTYVKRLEYDKFEQRAFIELGNGARTQYSYRTDNRRLDNLKTNLPQGTFVQNLGYDYDKVGNVTSLVNDVPVPKASQFGGPTKQSFVYDDLNRLTSAAGTFQFAPNKTNRYTLAQDYDVIHNIVSKQQTNDIVQPSGTLVNQHETTYSFKYAYGGVQPHAATHIDNRTFSYDANGNQTGWTNDLNGTRRNITWDDENRVQSIFDNGHETAYKYDDQGERVLKRGPQGETAYVNQYFTIRNRQIGTKNVYAGTTRVASKLLKKDPGVAEKDQYFYHPDHLSSSNYITDAQGQLYEHLEYFPFGETWVQESSNTQRTPYLFTGKEFDEETQLYYYGARYYDPRLDSFLSSDPLLSQITEGWTRDSRLLGAYTYAHNNPVIFVDPTGLQAVDAPTKAEEECKCSLLSEHARPAPRFIEMEPIVVYGRRPAQDNTSAGAGEPEWSRIARREIGVTEFKGADHNPRILEYFKSTSLGKPPEGDETAWCAAFCNWVLEQAGVHGTNSARALSFGNWGDELDRPAVGAVAVIDWGKGGKGHVGLVVGQAPNGDIVLLGGNQSNSVRLSAYKPDKIAGYHVPAGYVPSAEQYNLPTIKIQRGKSATFEGTR